ncbi:MAG: hypothetical protein A2V62_02440 [Nitrospirae bacterium RBG_19FT_COMBO_58_9]|nr:MAG: hypothetical protein A2V62_02440 [Nitrospirae bacterium RBG_19FT_COMBO_58_9]
MGKKGFKDLLVWQTAKDVAVRVCRVSKSQDLKAEARTQIQIACEAGHLKKSEYDSLDAEYEQLATKIGSLIRARSQASSQ